MSFPAAHESGFIVFGVYIPTGAEDSGVRRSVMSYLDRRVKLVGEAGELVAVGGDFNPGTSKYSGCVPPQPLPRTTSNTKWGELVERPGG